MKRMQSTRRAPLLGAASLLGGFEARADGVWSRPLFVIARGKNANGVHYDVRVREGGRLDPDAPVVVYWVMLAEDGRREALSLLERRFAHGFSVHFTLRGDALTLCSSAFPRRELAVRIARDGCF